MRFKAAYITIAIMAVFLTLFSSSCKKTPILSAGGTLLFSVDTLKFDTVFTAAGSFTTNLLIYNPQSEAVVISSIQLNEGVNSYFHLNVDGFPANGGTAVTNLKIAPHDSMYVFATVDINPNNKLTPFVVTDSLVVTMNGKNYYVPFTAYGQNAHYIVDSILTGNIVWDTVLPYVIINSAEVNTNSTLTINPGCRIYMHQNSGLIVLGKLLINGTVDDTVIFQGDRLDRAYFGYMGYPGEWGGLYFSPYSSGSRLSYTRLKNCGNAALGGFAAAIQVDIDSGSGTQLTMDHCIIENSIGYGVLSQHGTVEATNCLFRTTAAEALAIIQGVNDTFTDCTFANYGSAAVSHATNGTLTILNYYSPDGINFTYGALKGALHTCIVYGSLDSEVICDEVITPSAPANFLFDHCLLKMDSVQESFVAFNSCIFNQDPLFNNSASGDFHILATSPAVGAGNSAFNPINDLDGTARTGSDIGCYQHSQ